MDDNQHPDNRADGDAGQVTVHHSVHHPRRVDVRIHGAPGHPLDPPLSDTGLTVRVILWYFIMGALTFSVAFGAAYWVQAKSDYRSCIDRNATAAATDGALISLADAAEAQGDTREAAVLRKFQDRRDSIGTPECSRPPLTKIHRPGD
jgi:hypothetical protein